MSASILFVCTANRVRSPLAAAVARSVVEATALPVSISSAGLLPAGFPADPDMAHVAARRGYDLSAHVSRQVDAGLIERSDLVIAMTGRHVVDLVGMAPGATRRILTLREAGTAATLSAPSAWDPISLRRWAETPTDRCREAVPLVVRRRLFGRGWPEAAHLERAEARHAVELRVADIGVGGKVLGKFDALARRQQAP